MELITNAFDNLCLKYNDLLIENFSKIDDFKDEPIAKVRQLLRLVGLLHDIGHTPFSHAGEYLAPGQKHENVTISIIKEPSLLGTVLNELYWEGAIDWLERFINGSLPPQLIVLNQLISFQIDFDRTDYLLRDSLYCGVDYGKFDFRRLLESLAVFESAEGLQIAIDNGGVHVFEALILSRYQMNTQVYFHRTRRIYDFYLKKYLQSIVENKIIKNDIDFILNNDDFSMFELMKKNIRDGLEKDGVVQYASRIINRSHHKLIFEKGDHADALDMKAIKSVYQILMKDYPDLDFVFDEGKGNIHKLYVEGDQEIIEDLFVIDKEVGTHERLTNKSKIIAKIPKEFRVLRLYVDTNGNTERLKDLKIRAQDLFKQHRTGG
jgi:hypothetical protein